MSAQLEGLRAVTRSGCYLQAVRVAEGLIESGGLSPVERAEVHHIWSVCWHRLGNLFKALPQAERALQIARGSGAPEIASKALSNLVGMHVELGDWGRAIELGEEFLLDPTPAYLPYVHHNLGQAYQARHDHEPMLRHYRQAVAIAEFLGSPNEHRVQLRQQLAWQLLLLDRIAEADKHIEAAGALIAPDDEDGKREQILLGSLRAYQTGNHLEATEQAEEITGRGAPSSNDQKRQLAWASLIAGWVARDCDDLERAERFAAVALDMALELQLPEMMKRANRLQHEINEKREAAG